MSTRTVLIVEDESIVAFDLKVQLQKLGYEVTGIADSGEQAVHWVQARPPNIILMDVRLAGHMDGIEAAEAIRREHEVPIIFLTANSDADTVARAARTAAYGYLTKPYQIKELRAGIEIALTKFHMERQLRAADQWFSHTLRCVSDGVVLTELDGRVRFVNPAAERLLGWSTEEAMGHPIAEVVQFQTGDHKPGPAELLNQVIAHGRPAPITYGTHLLTRQGGRHVVDKTAGPVSDGKGHRLGAVLVLRDARERVAQEAQLQASEARFRSVFDHAPLGVALVSLSGAFIQANAAFCELIGTDSDTLMRLSPSALAIEADSAHETQRLQELMLEQTGVVQFERRYQRMDGRGPVWTLVSVSLVHLADLPDGSHPTCYLYQVSDLTQQKKAAEHMAELATERMKREVSELANTAKSEFLSRVSHEMRTPLNAVIGFSQLLLMQREADASKSTAFASQIHEAGKHLLLLVEDLLDLSRAAEGKLKMVFAPVALNANLTQVIDMLSPLAHKHGVTLETQLSADLIVQADAMRLRQVLLNLGSNAIKYNHQDGSVLFQAHRQSETTIELVIQDNGIGMTPQQMARLFQPFERLGLESTKIPGVGLGMMIARSLIEEMGGSLRVDSTPHQGTKLTIHLQSTP